MIVEEHGKWILYSHDGSKKLGEHATKAEAEAQEQAINIAKSERKDSLRLDAAGLAPNFEILENGFLRAPAYLSRAGIFEYRRADGSVKRELRPPEEVFKPESMRSFAQMPLTNDHPYSGRVDSENLKTWPIIGNVGENIDREGNFLRGRVLVMDQAAVEKVLKGQKTQLSCGYVCDVDETPGEWNGQQYDAVQRNIRGNHVALVTKGRAGPDVRVKLDNCDAVGIIGADSDELVTQDCEMIKLKLDGIDFEVAETTAQAFNKELAKRDAEIAEAKKAAETATAKADALDAEVKKVGEALKAAQDPAAKRAEIQARVALEKTGAQVLGAESKLDEMSDEQIRVEVVKKLSPSMKLDGKSADYIAAAFDAAVALSQTAKPAPKPTVVVVDPNAVKADSASSAAEARKRLIAESEQAYKNLGKK